MKAAVIGERAEWRGATKEHIRQRSVNEEQRSQTVLSAITLRAAVLSLVVRLGLTVTARCGDAPALAALTTARIPRRSNLQNISARPSTKGHCY